MPSSAALPKELLAQELRGPRYTSYPTALAFGPQFTVSDYVSALGESAHQKAPFSLYLHIPFCASNCFYCACNRVITRSRERIQEYVEAILEELRMKSELIGREREVVQIHFGGGTPNTLSIGDLAHLLTAIHHRLNIAESGRLELSMEVDPRIAEVSDIYSWRALGFNRLSFGVQDVDLGVQRAINRVQARSRIASLTEAVRRTGYSSLNYDLVYGLPKQTVESLEETLRFVLEQHPDRIAAYHYAHLPARFPSQRAIDERQLPSAEVRQSLREMIHSRLLMCGYRAIGLDHYALPQDPLVKAQESGTLRRNFQGYSTLAGVDILGVGVSSISQVGICFAQNESDLDRYLQAIKEGHLPYGRGYRQNADDRVRAAIIEAIMCHGAVDFSVLERRYGHDVAGRLAPELARLREIDPQQQWLSCGTWGLKISDSGRHLLRVVAMVFDRHLESGVQTAQCAELS